MTKKTSIILSNCMCFRMIPLMLFILLMPLLTWAEEIYAVDFSKATLKGTPTDWRDREANGEEANWRTSEIAALTYFGKSPSGLLIFEGPGATDQAGVQLENGTITATFQKSADDQIFFGLAGRVQDTKNFLSVRFAGDSRMTLVRTKDEVEQTLASWVTRKRYPDGGLWMLSLSFTGSHVTARLRDQNGVEQIRLDALDEAGTRSGKVGIEATTQAGVKDFKLLSTPGPAGKG